MSKLSLIRNNEIVDTLVNDKRRRAVITTLPGMGLNLIYAIFNGAVGIIDNSVWYVSLAVYYTLLCAMRVISVSYARKVYDTGLISGLLHGDKNVEYDYAAEEKAWKVFGSCGVMLAIMSVALIGAVIMLVIGEGGKSYPGLMIYAVATYTFYKMVIAIINMIKVRKQKSILLGTLRNISYADALVSMLALQSAMFNSFGQDSGEMIPITNALFGAGVCIMIFALGIYMVYQARHKRFY